MNRQKLRSETKSRARAWPFWIAAFFLPGLAACDFKGDAAAYLRRGLESKEQPGTGVAAVSSAPTGPASVALAPPTAAAPNGAGPVAAADPPSNSSERRRPYDAARSVVSAEPREVAPGLTAKQEAPDALNTVKVATTPSAAPTPTLAVAASSSSSSTPTGIGNRNVSIGGAAISGGNVSNAARVIAGLRGPLRGCYAHATDGTGSIRLTLNVGKTGAVTNVTAQRSGELANELVACAIGVAKGAQFEAPEGGAATVRVPVVFVLQ